MPSLQGPLCKLHGLAYLPGKDELIVIQTQVHGDVLTRGLGFTVSQAGLLMPFGRGQHL